MFGAKIIDSHKPVAKPFLRLPEWLMLCILAVSLSAGITYYLSRTEQRQAPNLLIGLPLVGEAICIDDKIGELSDDNYSFHEGFVKYKISNPYSERTIVVRLPLVAGYMESFPNSYSQIRLEACPKFAQRTETVVIPPGGSQEFVEPYQIVWHWEKPFKIWSWCLVFATDETEAEMLGEPYVGCLSFPVRMETDEEKQARQQQLAVASD